MVEANRMAPANAHTHTHRHTHRHKHTHSHSLYCTFTHAHTGGPHAPQKVLPADAKKHRIGQQLDFVTFTMNLTQGPFVVRSWATAMRLCMHALDLVCFSGSVG
jgi:hypothetical protein